MKYPILLPNIFNYPFTYESNKKLKVGQYVIVPFGKSKLTGLVWNNFEKNSNKSFKIKKIIQELDIPPLRISTLRFMEWFSKYNLIPIGMSLKLHLLSNEAIINSDDKEYEYYEKNLLIKQINLTPEQKNALYDINKLKNKFRVHLLQGTTGSGKTLVYFKSLQETINRGKQGLILLPEIGLTFEFEKKFKDFFGFNPAIWHSGISKKK